MPKRRDIRDRYTKIIGELAREHGSEVSGYEISEDATLAQCIGYAQRFIVGRARDEPHYRYDRYMRVLRSALPQQLSKTRTLIHIDIGCGPGLFTWVVRDYVRRTSTTDVELYGYDYSKQMVKLANIIWNRLGEEECYSCFHSTTDLKHGMRLPRTGKCRVLVTLGHVLVQTVDEASAIGDFARIIAMCTRMANSLVVAVDAQTGNRPEDFRRACNILEGALKQRGMTTVVLSSGRSNMVTHVKVTRRV